MLFADLPKSRWKEFCMNEKKKIKRSSVMIIITLIIVLTLGARLFYIQVIKGDYYASVGTGTIAKKVDIDASRGEILDATGVPLVFNKQTTRIVFDASYFPAADDNTTRADIIIKLIHFLESEKEEWIDDLPIELNKKGEYVFAKDRENDIAYLKSDKFLDLNDYATAANCMDALKQMYELEKYSDEDGSILWKIW